MINSDLHPVTLPRQTDAIDERQGADLPGDTRQSMTHKSLTMGRIVVGGIGHAAGLLGVAPIVLVELTLI